MGLLFSSLENFVSQQYWSLLLGGVIAIYIIILSPVSTSLKWRFKRFIRIQVHQQLMNRIYRGSNGNGFLRYYHTFLCYMQKTNNELLAKILQNNYSSLFFRDRPISFLSTHRPSSSLRIGDNGYASIDEFRAKVPLTTYEDYREYIDRMVIRGEKNQLSSTNIIYFATSSGTTGKTKLLPVNANMLKQIRVLTRVGSSVIWTCFRSSFPLPQQRAFQLYNGRKAAMYARSKNGTPMGPISEFFSSISSMRMLRFLVSTYNILSFDLIEEINDFETSTFVQLVFTLAVPDLYAYSVSFASVFLHTMKIIQQNYEEMSHCIATSSFDQSSLVLKNIPNSKIRRQLNQALKEVTMEYGGLTYRKQRADYIRQECFKRDTPGLLHRLWPRLIYVAATTGSSFAMYKEKIQFYCGRNLPVINMMYYASSEGFFGSLASIHTDEYILSPTSAFFEFIREEDVHLAQPKTLLLSEIEPGNRYELVCTTEVGLIRYRTGDIINCTRYLCRSDDLVPLPTEPFDIPRIPLISIAYRIGSLLNVVGEKTTEQHLMHTLERVIGRWKERGIMVRLSDFTSYAKLDVFPQKYVIFVELTDEQGGELDEQHIPMNVDIEVQEQLCQINLDYKRCQNDTKLGPLSCIFVRYGTFAMFLTKELVTDRVNPVQIKPHRLLKNERHIQFFYNNSVRSGISLDN